MPEPLSHESPEKGIDDALVNYYGLTTADGDLFDANGVTREGFRWARQAEAEALKVAPALAVCPQCGGPDVSGRYWLTLKGLQEIGR